MKSRTILSLVAMIIVLTACVFSKKNAKNENTGTEIQELVVERAFVQNNNDENYQISSISLKDTILNLSVKFKGENDDDPFVLKFNGMYAKSMPPIATLYLVQTVKGENEFIKEFKFNIAKAKYSNSDQTVIKINGWNERFILNH